MALILDTLLLSAEKTGNPPITDSSIVSLSANGVNTISLSTDDVGIAFDAESTLNGALSNSNIQGSVYRIDTAYDGKEMALVKTDGTYSTFTYDVNHSTQPLSSFTNDNVDVSTVNTRRLYLYGYR